VLFRADDGKDYFGCVTKVHRGVATVRYEANGKQVTASVTDAARLFSAD